MTPSARQAPVAPDNAGVVPHARHESGWEKRFNDLVEFHRLNGHFHVPTLGATARLHRWISHQRNDHHCGLLSPDQVQRLEAVGFPWLDLESGPERGWNRNFERLLEYRRATGHWFITSLGEYKVLRSWILIQRLQNKFGRLRPDRRQRLEAAGFPWVHPPNPAAVWERRFAELMEHHRVHGHFLVAGQDPAPAALRAWMNDQRRAKRTNQLRPDRQQRLEAAGFPWVAEPAPSMPTPTWERHFAELLAYRQRFGHCAGPFSRAAHAALGQWVSRQRSKWKRREMPPEALRRLEEIQFAWTKPWVLTPTWERRFVELLAYRQRFGHCDVPRNWAENPGLGLWVGVQRNKWKRRKMSPEALRRLQEVHFNWTAKDKPRVPPPRWERRFVELVAYRQRFGHCAVPYDWAENPGLGHWVGDQRRRRKRRKMSLETLRRLQEVHFVWVRKPRRAGGI